MLSVYVWPVVSYSQCVIGRIAAVIEIVRAVEME